MTNPRQFQFNDLSLLPAPDVIEKINYEQLLKNKQILFNGLFPLLLNNEKQAQILPTELVQTENETYFKIPVSADAGSHLINLETEPVNKVLQSDAYYESLSRNERNQAILQTFPAYATGSNLDHIASRYAVYRLTITPEDTTTTPPTPAVFESDDALRQRMLLAMEGFASGGAEGWYLFNTISTSGLVKHARVTSPEPCEIIITLLSQEGDGTANQELIETVSEYIHHKHRRVLGDKITVQSAEIIHYTVDATLIYYPGPSHQVSNNLITAKWEEYRKKSEIIGHSITDSGVKAALHQQGVYRVIINAPDLPLNIGEHQAPFCVGLNITDGGNYV